MLTFTILSLRDGSQTSSLNSKRTLILLDVSQSMNVIDMGGKSRLDASKEAILSLFSKQIGGEYSFAIFSGETQTITPFTFDTQLLATFVSGVTHKNLFSQGSDISGAIEETLTQLGDQEYIDVLIFTDGDEEEILLDNELEQKLESQNIHLVFIGVGSQKGGRIPTDNIFAPYLSSGGEIVISKIEENVLKSAAKKYNGKYIQLGDEIIRPDTQKAAGISLTFQYSILFLSFLSFMGMFVSYFYPYFIKLGRKY